MSTFETPHGSREPTSPRELRGEWYDPADRPARNIERLAALVEESFVEAFPHYGELPTRAQAEGIAACAHQDLLAQLSDPDTRESFEERIKIVQRSLAPESQKIEGYLRQLKTALKSAGVDADGVIENLVDLSPEQAALFEEFVRPGNPLFEQMRGVFRSIEPIAALLRSREFLGEGADDPKEFDYRSKRIRNKILKPFREGIAGFTDEGHFCESARNTMRKGNAYVISLLLGSFNDERGCFEARPRGCSLFGHFVDHLFLAAPVAEAHRQRIMLLADTLSTRLHTEAPSAKMVVRSVACGNGLELERILREPGNIRQLYGVDIRLEDIDLGALRDTQDRLIAAARAAQASQLFSAGPNISLLQFNLVTDLIHHYLVRDPDHRQVVGIHLPTLPSQHFAKMTLMAGIADYFDDFLTGVAMVGLYHQLAEEGDLILTFVGDEDPRRGNPDRGIQELLLGWNLHYRGPTEIRRLMGIFSELVARGNGDAMRNAPPTAVGPFLGFHGSERTDITSSALLHAAMRGDGERVPPFRGGEWAMVPTPNGHNWMLLIRKNWVGAARGTEHRKGGEGASE